LYAKGIQTQVQQISINGQNHKKLEEQVLGYWQCFPNKADWEHLGQVMNAYDVPLYTVQRQ
jgi:hypothetical protein